MFRLISAAGLTLVAAWGQTVALPSFEVASVKPAAPCCAAGQWRDSKAGVDRIDFPYATLRYSIAFGYRVKEFQVSGPAWLGRLRYNIVAKGPEGTRREQLPDMMQVLLAERFKLQVHHETKEFNVYVLTLGKNGPKFKESTAEPSQDGANIGMSMTSSGVGRMEVKNGDMTALANTLSRMLGRPVIDKTGLTGRYDLELEYTREDSSGMAMAIAPGGPAAEPGPSIFASVQHVGLKLDAQKLPLDAIVVDQVEKASTEN